MVERYANCPVCKKKTILKVPEGVLKEAKRFPFMIKVKHKDHYFYINIMIVINVQMSNGRHQSRFYISRGHPFNSLNHPNSAVFPGMQDLARGAAVKELFFLRYPAPAKDYRAAAELFLIVKDTVSD